VAMRQVPLPPDSPRGGILTQASILKVTANGTVTSPVPRGVWVMENILGRTPKPPPPNVSAIEPDTRGTQAVRDQLAKHREVKSCAACHQHIDPPGFALESFDVTGGWRRRYRSMGEGEPVTGRRGFLGRLVKYRLGLSVDSSGTMSDGQRFQGIDEFKRLLLARRIQVARCLVMKLAIYATGREPNFAERLEIEARVDRVLGGGGGLRALIHEVVQSDAFTGDLSKGNAR